MKENNNLLVQYFTNPCIIKDLLLYSNELWGFYQSELELVDNEMDKVSNRSSIL